jgi:hypothetical protein
MSLSYRWQCLGNFRRKEREKEKEDKEQIP